MNIVLYVYIIMYTTIVNPQTNKKVSIFSKKGRHILETYVNMIPNLSGGFRENIDKSDNVLDKTYIIIRSKVNFGIINQTMLETLKKDLSQVTLPVLRSVPVYALDDYINFEQKTYIAMLSSSIWIYFRTKECYSMIPRESLFSVISIFIIP